MAPLVDVRQNAFSVQDTMEDHAASNQVHGGGDEPQSPHNVLMEQLQDAFRNKSLRQKIESWDAILKFAKLLKQKRIVFGHNQDDVSMIVISLFDKHLSQTTICRFENGKLSLKNMRNIKPFMENYIMVTEKNPGILQTVLKEKSLHGGKRKRRTTISPEIRAKLEKSYMLQKKPDVQQMLRISEQTDLPKETVQTWFTNRRQNERKLMPQDKRTCILTMPMVSQHVPAPCNLPHGYMSLLMDYNLHATMESNANMSNHPNAQMYNYSNGFL